MRAGAFRFWLSRLWDVHLPRDAKLLKAHDPTHFERVLLQRRVDALASGAASPGRAMKLLRAEPREGVAWIRRAFQVFLRQPFALAGLFSLGALVAYAADLDSGASAAPCCRCWRRPASLVFMIATCRAAAGRAAAARRVRHRCSRPAGRA